MKLRTFLGSALLLVVAAIGAWMWSGNEESPTPTASPAAHPSIVQSDPGRTVPDPVPAGSTAAPTTQPPAEPVRIASSVVPGSPMGSGASLPPRPTQAALTAAERASISRPVPQTEGKADLENVQFMLRDFRARLGANPVGSNAEIMKAVMGGNSVRAQLGPPVGQHLNDQGELLDRWGTAYFFHQLSAENMEIRSAGPDRKMWTNDDLLTR